MQLQRRRFLHLFGGGLGGAALAPAWLGGCNSADPVAPMPPVVDPDAGKPWWLKGNYAPVEESESFDLTVVGALPAALDGVYLRNGPNPVSGESDHWFLGDGMVHGVRLNKGKADWYRARYIQTPLLNGGGSMIPTPTEHQANTSVVHHAGRLFCLAEIGFPYEISASDLSTIGPHDFAGQLKGAFTAHPKLDPVTGEMLFFGYDFLSPTITYHRVDPEGLLTKSEVIELPKAIMMHDFQVTPTHVVFMDLPILFDIDLAIAGEGFPFRWAPENGARIGVMPREGTADDLVWFAIDACYVFHTFNAFHDAEDPNVIHLDCVRYPEMWVEGANDFTATQSIQRYSLDLTTETSTLTQIDDRAIEFPRIDPRRQGVENRIGYAVGTDAPAAGQQVGDEPFDNILKYDFASGEVTPFSLPMAIDEATFVPGDGGEDEGWLLAYGYDATSGTSQLLVVDAQTMEETARVMLPTRVPHGFHGGWAASS